METLRLYRGVANVLPSKIEEYYAASYSPQTFFGPKDEEHTAGEGMYFSFNYDLAKYYMTNRKKNGYGIVGKYTIQGDYKIFDNSNVKDPVMDKLHKAEDHMKEKIENLGKIYYGFKDQTPEEREKENDLFQFLFNDDPLIKKMEQEKYERNKDNKSEGLDKSLLLKDELDKCGALLKKIKSAINEVRLSYDISIYNYDEVCVHNPKVRICLESFDLFLDSEETAQKVYDQLQTGELMGMRISGIDGSLVDVVSKILSFKELS